MMSIGTGAPSRNRTTAIQLRENSAPAAPGVQLIVINLPQD
jgi:hypothetical protein